MGENTFAPRVRGGINDGQYASNRLTEQYGGIVQQDNAPYAEATRRGYRYKVRTATAFAGIVGVPSTLANLEVVNNRLGYVMVVDTIFSWQLLGTAVVWAHTPWAAVGAKVYAANTALVVYSANGSDSITSGAGTDVQTAITQTVVESGWEVFPGSTMNFGLAAATPGGPNVGQVDGRLVVPYGKSLYIAVSASVNTASAFQCGGSFHWAAVTNET